MIWLLGTLATSAAACPATVADLRDATGRSEVAFAAAAESGFTAAVGEVRADLACLVDALGPADAAAVHRIEALDAFVAGNHVTVVAHFAAARRIEPGWQLPTSLALGDHPLRRDFDRAGTEPQPQRAAVASGDMLRVDGVRATEVPVGAPFVVQRFDAGGAVVASGMVPAGGSLPDPKPAAEVPVPVPLPVPSLSRMPAPAPIARADRRHPARVPLLVGAGVAAVASGLSVWQAGREKDAFWDWSTPPGAIDVHADRTNRWVLAAVASGGVAAGAIGTATLVGRW